MQIIEEQAKLKSALLQFESTFKGTCQTTPCSGFLDGRYRTLTMASGDHYLSFNASIVVPKTGEQTESKWAIGSSRDSKSEMLMCKWGENRCKVGLVNASV
jgi:hypothetical protein